jgi:hypothetical protein
LTRRLAEDDVGGGGGGLLLKLGAVAVVLGGLGMIGLVAGWWLWKGDALAGDPLAGDSVVVVDPPPADSPVRPPDGTAEPDWAPNAAGKGGVVLEVPGGATEVSITNTTRFHQEWTGLGFLRLRDLDPGVYRTRVKPRDGAATRADFTVGADRTCRLRFEGASWAESECR